MDPTTACSNLLACKLKIVVLKVAIIGEGVTRVELN